MAAIYKTSLYISGMTMTLEGQKNPSEKNYKLRGQNLDVKQDTNPHITIYGPPDVVSLMWLFLCGEKGGCVMLFYFKNKISN